MKLKPPDSHHLDAALGWVELGNAKEAGQELEQISEANRSHPEVQQVRWRMHSVAGQWDVCLALAQSMIDRTPGRAFGWIHASHALRKLGRVGEALELICTAMNRFPPNATMPYYAACYSARLGRIAEARNWLAQAFACAESDDARQKLKRRALDEEDLDPLRAGE